MKRVLRGLLKGGRYYIRRKRRVGTTLRVFLGDNLKGRDILPTKELVARQLQLPTTVSFESGRATLVSVVDVDVATRFGYATDNVGDLVIVFGVEEWGAQVPKEETIDGKAVVGCRSVTELASWRR